MLDTPRYYSKRINHPTGSSFAESDDSNFRELFRDNGFYCKVFIFKCCVASFD